MNLKVALVAALSVASSAYAQKPELVGEATVSLSDQVQYEIRWQTLLPSIGRVEYGPDDAYGRTTAPAPALEGEHVHLLTNLTPDATYHYRIVTRDWSGNETVTEDRTFVAAATPEALAVQAGAPTSSALVDDTFENGLDETIWRVYSNTESGQLAAEDGHLTIQNVGNGTDYGQLGLALLEPIDLTRATTTVTVSYTETGNAEQNPGFWNVGDLEGDDNWNHPGVRATVSGEGVTPTATPSAEGTWTPPEGVEGLQAPYTLTWTITPPEGEGEFSSTMQIDGEEVYSGTFTPGAFNPEEAYFYLYTSSPTEEGATAIDAVTVEQEGQGTFVAAPEPAFDPSTSYPVTQGSLQVDGDLAELGDTTGVNLEAHAAVQMEPYNGPEDLSGNVWLRWDDDNLYLAARVQDDVHDQTFAEGEMWQGDSLQLALAAGAPGEAEGWYEYGFALTEDGPQVWRWLAPEGVETGLVEAGLEVTRDDEDQATVYEVALPWAELAPLSAETGQLYSFSFIANDSDGDGRKGWLEVGSGIGGAKDPGLFLPFELAAAVGQTAVQAPTLPEGAVAAWLFDEGEGETVADAVGESDGTFTNPQWAEGQFGGAAQIQPGQNYISVPGSEALSPSEALTVTAWVYLNRYGEGEFPNRRVLQMGSYDPESEYGVEDNAYRLLFEFGEFIFDAGPEAEPRLISVPQDEHITLETWHHVAGVYSGDQITLYVDGEQVAQQEANGGALSAPADGRLFIGTKSDLAPEGDWWDGRLDEVAIFNRALSQEEIQSVMQGLKGAAPVAATAPAAPQAGTEDHAIFRAPGPITVDGNLSDWSQRGPIQVGSSMVVADAPEVTDEGDLSATANLTYDDDWVYLGADVTDDVLVFERTGDAIWQTDSLEVWFGSQQFGVAVSDAAPYLHSFGGMDIEEAEVAAIPHDGGYTVEVALPRAVVEETLEMTLEPGASLPVAVGANDADEEGGERVGQIYYPEGWTWGEPDTFAPLSVTE
ncbi:MAG: CBM9 [uncultured Truepera sp.]|uniref:CBM9 n=1 Tax=uncultured Truepera sp. TaxID=543023 RepID=A0A6J4VPB9_9DEIN|nr:MAG: CBM9 [uncultured Truepera sp.]